VGALSSKDILARIYHSDPEERLVITPLLDVSKQISKAAVDVRLGSEFAVLRQTKMTGLVVRTPLESDRSEAISREVSEAVDTTYVPIGSVFVLHPGQFVLTSTLEYISLPNCLMAYVIGRSSWGRLGLNIATATMVAPGFKGAITFEMVNLGTVPIGLYPGTRIAQLVFHQLTQSEAPETAYGQSGSKYIVPVGPEFSKIGEDADWDLIRQFAEPRDQ
jgi:dCTP deaminase